MWHYVIQPRDWIFVIGHGLLSFVKNIGKNVSKNLSIKYTQKHFHHAKQSAMSALNTTSKRAIKKTAEATGDLIGDKISDKIKTRRTSTQNTSEAVPSETEDIKFDTEISKERHYPPEKGHILLMNLDWYNI